MSLITDNTQIRLISELAPAGGLVSNDLLFLERGSVNYNQTYSGLVAGLVDDVTTNLVGNKIQVKDNGIKTAKIQNNAVSLPKLATIATDKIIGRTTAGTGNVELVTIEQTLNNNTNTLASSNAIKSYVDGALFATSFESSEQNIPANDIELVVQHGLSSKPKLWFVVARCIAAQYGYANDDEVTLGDFGDASDLQSVWVNVNDIGIVADDGMRIAKRGGGGGSFKLVSGNWQIVFYAYL